MSYSYCPICGNMHHATKKECSTYKCYDSDWIERKTQPHRCPVCNGYGTVPEKKLSGLDFGEKTCPACNGACIVWG